MLDIDTIKQIDYMEIYGEHAFFDSNSEHVFEQLLEERRYLAGLYYEVNMMLEESTALYRVEVSNVRLVMRALEGMFGENPSEDFISADEIRENCKNGK